MMSTLMHVVLALAMTVSPGEIDALKARLEQHDSVRDRYRLGVLHLAAGHYDDAIEAWHAILANRQSGLALSAKVKLARSIAIAHFKADRLDRAWTWIEVAFKRAPDDARVINARIAIRKALDRRTPPPPPPPAPTAIASPAPVKPVPTPEEVKQAFLKGEADYLEGAALVEQAADAAAAQKAFDGAIAHLEVATQGDYRKAKALFYLGSAHMFRYMDDARDLDVARDRLEESLKLDEDKSTLVNLATTYGLLDNSEKQIASLERALEIQPNTAEWHFRLAMAYDKSGRKDAARKTFENAKTAIRINAEYKKKFQNVLKNSTVAAEIAEIVGTIIKESEQETLTDAKTEEYARKFQEMLGSDSVKIDEVKGQLKKSGGLAGFIKSDEGKKLLDSPQGRKLQKVLETEQGKKLQDRALKAEK